MRTDSPGISGLISQSYAQSDQRDDPWDLNYWTVTVACMKGWIVQKYGNVVGVSNDRWYDASMPKLPLSNSPVSAPGPPEVTVWGAESWLVQVIVVPAATVMSASANPMMLDDSTAGGGGVGVAAGVGVAVDVGGGVAAGSIGAGVATGAGGGPAGAGVGVAVPELVALEVAGDDSTLEPDVDAGAGRSSAVSEADLQPDDSAARAADSVTEGVTDTTVDGVVALEVEPGLGRDEA